LAILSENLPKSTHEEIKIELVSPASASNPPGMLQEIDKKTASTDDQCLVYIVNTLSKLDAATTAGDANTNKMQLFLCAISQNIFWAKWLR
jgi:hypothetical protein